jgi:hypothetical protein
MAAKPAAKLMVVVVFPTPPFCMAIAIVRAMKLSRFKKHNLKAS